MAQNCSERREKNRVKPAMKWGFHREPRVDSVGLPFGGHLTRERAVAGGVDGEAEARAVRVEDVWQQLKMSSEKNRES